MLLIKIALAVLIIKLLWPGIKRVLPDLETIKEWLGIESPSRVYMDACHAGLSSVDSRVTNRLYFLKALEMFCRVEGLDLKVFEDFKEDALVVRICDTEKNLVMQTLVKRVEYEEMPAITLSNIKNQWRGGNNGDI